MREAVDASPRLLLATFEESKFSGSPSILKAGKLRLDGFSDAGMVVSAAAVTSRGWKIVKSRPSTAGDSPGARAVPNLFFLIKYKK